MPSVDNSRSVQSCFYKNQEILVKFDTAGEGVMEGGRNRTRIEISFFGRGHPGDNIISYRSKLQ